MTVPIEFKGFAGDRVDRRRIVQPIHIDVVHQNGFVVIVGLCIDLLGESGQIGRGVDGECRLIYGFDFRVFLNGLVFERELAFLLLVGVAFVYGEFDGDFDFLRLVFIGLEPILVFSVDCAAVIGFPIDFNV